MEQFPPNSDKSRASARGPKRVERVTSGAVRRRKPLGKQFRQTFFSGDARTALDYMVANTVVPAAQEMILDAINAGVSRLIYGDSRPRRGATGPLGHVAYNRQYQRGPEPMRAAPMGVPISRPSRMRHSFDEIVIESRQEAEEVLDRMYDLISQYDSVSVADLYELTGIQSSHVDKKWGWEELQGSGVGRVRGGGGYVLALPEPVALG